MFAEVSTQRADDVGGRRGSVAHRLHRLLDLGRAFDADVGQPLGLRALAAVLLRRCAPSRRLRASISDDDGDALVIKET